jgi:hypothetical protein
MSEEEKQRRLIPIEFQSEIFEGDFADPRPLGEAVYRLKQLAI